MAVLIKDKARILTDLERITVLSFDEMYVNHQVCFDKSLEQVFGPNRAVQVIMCRGLFAQWKQPIYFDFDTAITKDILFNVINELHACQYTVIAIVNDMGPGNMALWNDLGINMQNTCFNHPSDESKQIFVFADVPHLLKLLRNHFLDHGFVFDGQKTV